MRFTKPKTYRQWKGFDSPEITLNLQTITVLVDGRQLRAQWNVDLALDLAAYHNIDAEGELTRILAEQIAREIDNDIIRDLISLMQESTYQITPSLILDKPTPFKLHNDDLIIPFDVNP